MWTSCAVFACVVLLLIVLVWYTSQGTVFPGASPWLFSLASDRSEARESFDTGYNHDLGAMDDYYGSDLLTSVEAARAATLRARYTWSEPDPLGLTVYDRFYEKALQEAQTVSPSLQPVIFDRLYATESSVEQPPSSPATSVDEPFGTFNAQEALYHVSDLAGMYSPQPSTVVNGQPIVLSQKAY